MIRRGFFVWVILEIQNFGVFDRDEPEWKPLVKIKNEETKAENWNTERDYDANVLVPFHGSERSSVYLPLWHQITAQVV